MTVTVSIKNIAAGKLPDILGPKLGQELIQSAKNRNIEQIRKLLKMPLIDVNVADNDGYTALVWAARNGRVEIVKELLKNEKVDVNAADNDGYTALMWAASNGKVEIPQLIANKLGLDIEVTR